MDARGAAKGFGLSMDTIREYEQAGLLRKEPERDGNYLEVDIQRLGLIDTLLKAGFTTEETKQYLELAGADAAQVRMLRQQRKKLLNDIHAKQQTLDEIDFIIWKKQKQ